MSDDIVDQLRETAGCLINDTIEDGSVSVIMLTDAADLLDRLRAELARCSERTAADLQSWNTMHNRALKAEARLADAVEILRRNAGGYVSMPPDIIRCARCPSDGRGFVGECVDAGTCGCSVGLFVPADLSDEGLPTSEDVRGILGDVSSPSTGESQ